MRTLSAQPTFTARCKDALLRAAPGAFGRILRTARASARFAHPAHTMLRLAAPRLRLLCWPGRASPSQVLFHLCALNGYALGFDPRAPYDLGVHFTEAGPCALPPQPPVLNRHCRDISKGHVASIFEQVFGRALSVDPTRHAGPMLCKSQRNYTHDGVVLQGPIPPEAVRTDCVYQRFIEAEDEANAIDLRTPIYGGRIPLVYLKRRPLGADRFAKVTATSWHEPAAVFSPQEQAELARFAAAMGLDYGELDVLRDRRSGDIYVVDVANTPAGPPASLGPDQARAAVTRLAEAFAALASAAVGR